MFPLTATPSTATIGFTLLGEREHPFPAGLRAPNAQSIGQLADLRRWFFTEFSVINGQTGDVVSCAPEHRHVDWLVRGVLCREVASRGRPEIVDEDDPWLMLALPFTRGEDSLVAVGVFLYARRPTGPHDMARIDKLLGGAATDWAGRQTSTDAAVLDRLATIACEKLAASEQNERLETEVEKLSTHLGSTFEEISLLYRLTHNLKLSSNDAELGRQALEWLSDVVPAESFALQLVATADVASPATDSRTQPVLLTLGDCDLTVDDFSSLVSELELGPASRPVVLNNVQDESFGWQFPTLRGLVIVPIAEGGRLFGWLAVVNHCGAGEFGTAEASLLGSVGAMLGIHSGNIDLYRQQADLFTGVVKAMSSTIDAKDPYTRGHSDRVARVAVRLAEELGCDGNTIKTIYFAGLLHDIGKIGINEDVLRKPGKLTEAEFEHIKTHVIIGHRILADLRSASHMLPVVLHHHEAWDGSGYPHGLAGEAIPYLARIVAVADSYDAMASNRPYRPGMADERIDAIIRSGAGKQWDADVVDAFFRARDDIRAIADHASEAADRPSQNGSNGI